MYVEQRAFKKRLVRVRAAAHGPRKFTARAACRLQEVARFESPRLRALTPASDGVTRPVQSGTGGVTSEARNKSGNFLQ